ncbi:UNVERIFIED_CONTAM: hypothetical protein Sindi_2279400 [Sesamum indicum]
MEALETRSLEYVAKTVSSKKRISPLSVCDRGISYALGDAITLYESVAIVVNRIGKGGSNIEKLGIKQSQVLSVDVMGTDT